MLAVISMLLSIFGLISYSFIELITLLSILIVVCYATNLILGKLFRVTLNIESSFITALVLFFLLWPSLEISNLLLASFAGAMAIASKFILVYKKKHIFNPAAFGAVALILFNSGAVWWVATPWMLPLTLVLCFLIVRKIRRVQMFLVFLSIAFVSFITQVLFSRPDLFSEIWSFFTSFPLIFFGGIMLTEPITTPSTKKWQLIYAALLGFLFSWQGSFPVILTTELVLILGNFFSFVVSPKYRLSLRLEAINKIAADTIEFVFGRPSDFKFQAGQYLEWTLPMRQADSRGNRRFFTIASSPTEEKIKLGIKFNDSPSSFKRVLRDLKIGSFVAAGQLKGDFTLPRDNSKKIVFIAGGIGITPFRSMIKSLIDEKDKRNIVLFYSNKEESEIAYKELLSEAQAKIGIKTVYIVSERKTETKGYECGHINIDMLQKYAPDFKERTFYLSGPASMVNAYKKLLSSLGLNRTEIVTDYFPGF